MPLDVLSDPSPYRSVRAKQTRADVESLLSSSSSRYLLFNSNLQVLVTNNGSLSPKLFTVQEANKLTTEVDGGRRALPRLFLTTTPNGVSFCAFHLRGARAEFANSPFANVVDLAEAVPRLGHVAGHARSLFAFHASHRYCGTCGGATASEIGGVRRRCTGRRCGVLCHPRMDPIVMLLIINRAGDRALLARKRHYVSGEYRCLSGHVEHGEGVDDAVRRKAFEHFGIGIEQVRWLDSHAWPYPYCLMMGFVARATEDELLVDYNTIEKARWFSVDEINMLQVYRKCRLSEQDMDGCKVGVHRNTGGTPKGSTPNSSRDDEPRYVPMAPRIIGQLIQAFVQGDDICKFP